MDRKSSIENNDKRKRLNKKFKNKRQKLKQAVMDKSSSLEERFNASLALSKLPRNSAKIRIRNRCVLTGRPRGYHRDVGLSRIALRQLASFGKIPGMIKSSW